MPKFTKQQKQTINKIYTTLKKAGFDDISIAGMLGNALSESSFDPDSVSKSDYHGLWQNSRDIYDRVVDLYGNHNIDTQLQYVIDWANAAKNVTKGKHRDWLATGAGRYKKTGYKTARDAADAFMKLYERPVIMKDGEIVGYQKQDERLDNAMLMHDYLNQTFGGTPQITVKDTPDGNRVMTFTKPNWAVEESPFTKHKKILPEPINTDYSMKREVPEQYDAMNAAGSPAYGGYNPRIPTIREINNKRKKEIEDIFERNAVAYGHYKGSLLPSIPELITKGKEDYVASIMGSPSMYNDYAPEYPKLVIPGLSKGKDLPKFYPGKDSEQVERGGVVYNVDPSAIGASELDVTVPNINITPSDRPLYQRYDAYNSTYDPNAIRAITDWIPGIGDVSQGFDAVGALNRGDYLNAAMLGAGLVIPKTFSSTAKTALKNLPAEKIKQITDNFIKFADKNRSKVARTIKGQDYYNFMNTFGHMLDKSRISVDDVYSGMRGRIKELASTLDPHATYDGGNIIRYSEDGVPLGTLTLYDGVNDYGAKHVGSIVSNKPGVGRKLYDSAINAVGRIITGEDLLSAPKTISTWKHYPTKKLIGRNGKHSNVSMLQELGEDAQKLEEVNNGPVYLLDLPSQYVPTKHAKIFDPTILDNHGNMHIDLQDPSLFKATIPIVGSAALYNSMKDSGILPTQVLTDGLNEYNKGKNIYIKPSKRGTFTAAAKKHGKSVRGFANQVLSNPGKYSKAMRKKAQFAKNASKWGK